jgi:hypothetical protein
MPPKKKNSTTTKQRGVGARCDILLKYLHPQVLINSKIPKDGWTHKQELTDCVVVSRETKNIDRKAKVVIVVKHTSFGDSVIYCAERYAKVKVQGGPDGFFNKKLDLPIIANAPTFAIGDLDKPIDTSVIDKMGRSTRSEDIALARSQGLDVDDDNEPAPENIPAAGARIDNTTNLHGQEWGWGGTCHRKTKHHLDVDPQILNYSRSDLCNQTKLDMFLLFFPIDYFEDVLVKETSLTLVRQAHNPLSMGELVRFFGCIFFMSCFSGVDRRDFFSSDPISLATGAPYRLTQFMPGYRFEQIMSCLTITKSTPDNTDRFWEMRLLISAWNKNMQDIYVPSWVSCLDESMSIWNMRWTCPGYVFCPRKPHPVGNEYHTIADGLTTILYAAEIVMGKDKPDDFESQYEREEGKTSSLLARLTRSIWHSGKVVILDSGFCVLQALINLKKKRGLYAGAVIKKRKYWPKFIQGMCYSYIYMYY